MPGKSAGVIKIENQLDLRTAPRHPVLVEGVGNQVLVGDGADIQSQMVVQGDNNRLTIGAQCVLTRFKPTGGGGGLMDSGPETIATLTIQGSGNIIEIAENCRLGVNLTVIGDNHRVRIGPGCAINGFLSLLCPTGSTLSVGAGTTMVQVSIQLHEPGEITFGEDCMVSSQTYVSLSDIHPIYDRATGARINPPASVTVGSHVWLGLRCMILKGATIGDGAVVAAGAILSGPAPANAVMAGVPARVVRENIVWRRELSEDAPEPAGLGDTRRRRPWPFSLLGGRSARATQSQGS